MNREQIAPPKLEKKSVRVTWTMYFIKCSDEVIRFKEDPGRAVESESSRVVSQPGSSCWPDTPSLNKQA